MSAHTIVVGIAMEALIIHIFMSHIHYIIFICIDCTKNVDFILEIFSTCCMITVGRPYACTIIIGNVSNIYFH